MKALNLIIEEFRDLGSRVAFNLKNGEHHEGYILEIETDYLTFGEGGPLAPAADIEIQLIDLDLKTLAYWDDLRRCYMDADWNEARNCWQIKPSRQAHGWIDLR
jgi:hypothetical protein